MAIGWWTRLTHEIPEPCPPTAHFYAVDIADKSFDFVIKTAPAAVQLLDASKAKQGAAEPNRQKVGSVTWEQVKAIAEDKMPDLNCFTIESAMSMVAGTARSMGIQVTGERPF